MKKSIIIFILSLFVQIVSATGNPKVILRGDYPDPSIMRDGEDFYMTHSPFVYAPGFLIWHSRNLTDWEPICRVKIDCSRSMMAPDILKHNGKYYIYYPSSYAEIFVITADNIRGPWSEPVKLNMDIKGIDPGHVVGEDGKRYLFTNNGWITPLSDDGLAVTGKSKKVYDGWEYPAEWETEGMYLESPKLIFKDGYYYMTSAEGGTAGPATSHMCVMARSKSVFGPWENSPYNPLVHTYEASEPWWSKGHGTLIDDAQGNWWMVYHAYANGYHTLGRQTLLEPMEYKADGWFATKEGCVAEFTDVTPNHTMKLNDDFESPNLGLQWMLWDEDALDKLILEDSSLIIPAKGSTPADGRILLMTPEDQYYMTEVEIETDRRNKGGLVLFYNTKAFAGIMSDGKNFFVYNDATASKKVPNRIGNRFKARILNRGNKVSMQVKGMDGDWISLSEGVDVSAMNHNNYNGFLALRVGLLSAGKGSARFRTFRYCNTDTDN